MPASSEPVPWARLTLGGQALRADLNHGTSLAPEQRFDASQPRAFGAAPAHSEPLAVPGFTGSVASGASCNCSTLRLTPHCNGTHTECVGHLTVEALDAARMVPAGPLLALLVSAAPQSALQVMSEAGPAAQPGDVLITATALQAAWQRAITGAPAGWQPQALVLRTLPNEPAKMQRDHDADGAAYLSSAAARWLAAQHIEHLIVDLPSLDRMQDDGALAAHRAFFGLPAGSTRLADAQRAQCTVSELAYVPDALADGFWLLWIQVPQLAGDAVPSRPLLYPVEPA